MLNLEAGAVGFKLFLPDFGLTTELGDASYFYFHSHDQLLCHNLSHVLRSCHNLYSAPKAPPAFDATPDLYKFAVGAIKFPPAFAAFKSNHSLLLPIASPRFHIPFPPDTGVRTEVVFCSCS